MTTNEADRDNVAQRLDRLEAIEAIRRLKALYCHYCDNGYDAAKLAELFTEDAVWDAGEYRGRYVGREAIRQFFAKVSAVIPFAAHLAGNAVIEVDSNCEKGNGVWRMIMPCTLSTSSGNLAALQVAQYHECYRREDETWRIASLRVQLTRLEIPQAVWNKIDR